MAKIKWRSGVAILLLAFASAGIWALASADARADALAQPQPPVPTRIKVGVSGGDGELIWAKVKEIAKRNGLDIEVIVFNDYLLPNAALDSGDLDANAFQHKPFLDNQIQIRGYKITAIAGTIVEPIGLYSLKVKAVANLADGAQLGIPNDPSNGGRALLLLQQQGLIKLRDGTGIVPSVRDVISNPKRIKIRELDAAQLPRSLQDLDAAVINTNYALQAKLHPGRDSIAIESRVNNPYGNVIAVRTVDKDKPVFKTLIAAYQNDEVRQYIVKQFDGAILPVF
jgi:D-methionine transport system substrate-binding protein